jgi:hypothetical protein
MATRAPLTAGPLPAHLACPMLRARRACVDRPDPAWFDAELMHNDEGLAREQGDAARSGLVA